jgi:hypothetical protein
MLPAVAVREALPPVLVIEVKLRLPVAAVIELLKPLAVITPVRLF